MEAERRDRTQYMGYAAGRDTTALLQDAGAGMPAHQQSSPSGQGAARAVDGSILNEVFTGCQRERVEKVSCSRHPCGRPPPVGQSGKRHLDVDNRLSSHDSMARYRSTKRAPKRAPLNAVLTCWTPAIPFRRVFAQGPSEVKCSSEPARYMTVGDGRETVGVMSPDHEHLWTMIRHHAFG